MVDQWTTETPDFSVVRPNYISNVPSTVEEFVQATSWFLSKTPVTRAQWDLLSERARRKAFTISHVTSADLIRDVHKVLDRAIRNGASLSDFKRLVGQRLMDDWSGIPGDPVKNPEWRIETIYRTHTASAYNAGRYYEISDPDLLLVRPYWQLVAIMDNRVTDICEAANGTVLRHDHPWWQKNYPPRHFNCRCTVRSLREKTARELGIDKVPPAVEAQNGFGLLPDASEWKPDLSKYPDDIREELEDRLARMPEREPLPYPGDDALGALSPPEDSNKLYAAPDDPTEPLPSDVLAELPEDHPGNVDFEQWKQALVQKYPNLPHVMEHMVRGREVELAGLSLTKDSIQSLAKRLPSMYTDPSGELGKVLGKIATYAEANPTVPLGSMTLPGVTEPQLRVVAALLGYQQRLGPTRGTVDVSETNKSERNEATLAAAMNWWNAMLPHGLTVVTELIWGKPGSGTIFDFEKRVITFASDEQAKFLIHELAHAIEACTTVPRIVASAKALLTRRTQGQPLLFRFLAGIGKLVFYREGGFVNRYFGTIGGKGNTEIFSMSAQYLAESPLVLYNGDPDTFWWFLGILGGF